MKREKGERGWQPRRTPTSPHVRGTCSRLLRSDVFSLRLRVPIAFYERSSKALSLWRDSAEAVLGQGEGKREGREGNNKTMIAAGTSEQGRTNEPPCETRRVGYPPSISRREYRGYLSREEENPSKISLSCTKRTEVTTMWIDKGRYAQDTRDTSSLLLVSSIETIRAHDINTMILLYNWSRYDQFRIFPSHEWTQLIRVGSVGRYLVRKISIGICK